MPISFDIDHQHRLSRKLEAALRIPTTGGGYANASDISRALAAELEVPGEPAYTLRCFLFGMVPAIENALDDGPGELWDVARAEAVVEYALEELEETEAVEICDGLRVGKRPFKEKVAPLDLRKELRARIRETLVGRVIKMFEHWRDPEVHKATFKYPKGPQRYRGTSPTPRFTLDGVRFDQ